MYIAEHLETDVCLEEGYGAEVLGESLVFKMLLIVMYCPFFGCLGLKRCILIGILYKIPKYNETSIWVRYMGIFYLLARIIWASDAYIMAISDDLKRKRKWLVRNIISNMLYR